MERIRAYITDAYNELMYKVSWPTWKELQSSAVIVLVASLIIALFVMLMDMASFNLMSFIYEIVQGR